MKVNLPYMDGMGHDKRIISTTLLIMVWTLQKGQVWLCFSQGSELDLQTTSDPMFLGLILSLKLIVYTCKWMVGKTSFFSFWGQAYFQVQAVSFREGSILDQEDGVYWWTHKKSSRHSSQYRIITKDTVIKLI